MDKIFDQLNIVVLAAGLLFTFTLLLIYFKSLRSRTLISFLPNIWTSLGILGTFVSIVRSLGNSGAITDLPKIIEQITPAFETSIIGIIGAIATSLMVKFIFAKEDKKYELENKRKSYAKDMTPELLLDSISESIKTTNIKIDNLASQIASGILMEVDRHLTSKMEELSRDHAARLVTIFEREEDIFTNAVAKVNSAVGEFEGTMRQISSVVTDSTSSVAVAAADGIARMSDLIAARIEEISCNFVSKAADIEEATLNLLSHNITNRYQELMQMNEDSIREVEGMIRTMQNQIASQTAQDVSAIHNGIFSQVNQQLHSIKDDMNQIIHSVSQSLNDVTNNLAMASHVMDASSTNYQGITTATGEIKQSFIRLEAALSSCVSKLDTHSSRIESMISKYEDLHELNYKLSYELTQLKKEKSDVVNTLADGSHICPNCKTPNPAAANFCRQCRYKFV